MGAGAATIASVGDGMIERPAEVGRPSPNCVTKAIPCWGKVGPISPMSVRT